MNTRRISGVAAFCLLGLNAQSAYAQFFGPPISVPEPSILTLVAIGGAAIGIVKLCRRRNKK